MLLLETKHLLWIFGNALIDYMADMGVKSWQLPAHFAITFLKNILVLVTYIRGLRLENN